MSNGKGARPSAIVDRTSRRQSLIYNETGSRVMKSHLVTEVELNSLSQCENSRLFGFAVGGFMASIAVAMLIEWQVNEWPPGPWAASAFGFTALCFFGWGIKAWRDRRTVLDNIMNPPDESESHSTNPRPRPGGAIPASRRPTPIRQSPARRGP